MEKVEISLKEWDIVHPGLAVYLISTMSREGIFNVAPYGMVMPISYHPLIYAISIGKDQDTYINIKETGQFALNLATGDLLHQINITANRFPKEVDEFKEADLTSIDGVRLDVPRVKECKAHIECRLKEIVEVEKRVIIFGEAVSLSVDKEVYVEDVIKQKELLAPIFYSHKTYFSLGRYVGDRKS